jgi:hypothetical protein
MENDKALSLLGKRLQYLDNLDWFPRQESLVTSLLAGNMFDWGAREVANLMENTDFGFHEARSKIPGIYLFVWKIFSCNICVKFTQKLYIFAHSSTMVGRWFR